jgi:cobalamin biosynthesis protein CobT
VDKIKVKSLRKELDVLHEKLTLFRILDRDLPEKKELKEERKNEKLTAGENSDEAKIEEVGDDDGKEEVKIDKKEKNEENEEPKTEDTNDESQSAEESKIKSSEENQTKNEKATQNQKNEETKKECRTDYFEDKNSTYDPLSDDTFRVVKLVATFQDELNRFKFYNKVAQFFQVKIII